MVSEFDRVICSTDMTKIMYTEAMADATPMDYDILKEFVKDNCPRLYENLCLDYPNPYASDCKENEQFYILAHSMKEYFIRK